MTDTRTYQLPDILNATPLSGFRKDLNRFLGTDAPEAWRPAIDMFDDGHRLILQAELSGVTKSDVDVHVDNGTIEIRGRRNVRRLDTKGARDFHRERRHGGFRRAIPLPSPVDTERVVADLEHGLLTVTLPKTEAPTHERR